MWILSILISLNFSLASESCQSLDGLWEGRCRSDNGEMERVRWNIRQDNCEEFFVNNEHYIFGETTHSRQGNHEWDLMVSQRFILDADGETYHYNTQQRGRHLPTGRRLYSIGFGDMKIKEDQLHFFVDMHYELSGHPANIWDVRTRCKLDQRIN